MTASAVSTGRSWHEVYLLLISAAYALGGLVTGRTNQALDESFPGWSLLGWYGGLFAMSVLAVAGIVMGTIAGLVLERAAMWVLTGLCVAYVLGALAGAPLARVTTALGVGYIVAFALANVARARQIDRTLAAVLHGVQRPDAGGQP